jgi:hypothetical protein
MEKSDLWRAYRDIQKELEARDKELEEAKREIERLTEELRVLKNG